MTLFEIVALYVALNILLLLYLSLNVSRVRHASKISLGTGDNDALLKASRAHGNFIENTPLALIGLLLLASLQAAPLFLHALGILLTLGRVLHAVGLTKGRSGIKARQIGMLFTFIVFLLEALYLLYAVIT